MIESIPPIALLIAGIAVVALLLRPAPRTVVIYMPLDSLEEGDRPGCLPLLGAAIVVLIALIVLSAYHVNAL